MIDKWQGCTETSDECGLHNFHCGYPNCHKGRRDSAKKIANLVKTVTLPALPEHMEYRAVPKPGHTYNGNKCCDGWCDGSCQR